MTSPLYPGAYPNSTTPPQRPVQPYYVREHQGWAVEQERMRHIQAIYQVGEYAAFFLMWHQLDYEAGLVQRCARCYANSGSHDRRVAEVYGQATQNKCLNCYGTTFEGGIRARIIRPSLFIDVDETERPSAKGSMHEASLTVESTVDFRLREGDYVVRADDTRWRCSTPTRTNLRTGFGHPHQERDGISYNAAPCKLEDPTSVAYQLSSDVFSVLSRQHQQPAAFTDWELAFGPLMPTGFIA